MTRALLTAVMAVVAVAVTASFAAAQVPRTPDGHPDLSGVWWPGRDLQITPLTASSAPPARPPAGGPPPAPRPRPASFASLYQPWAMEKARTLGDKDDPSLR